jgi:hypothetical protein
VRTAMHKAGAAALTPLLQFAAPEQELLTKSSLLLWP